MSTTEIEVIEKNREIVAIQNLSREQIDLLKRTVAKDCTDDEFALFIQQCKASGLNPFARQIYAIKRKDTLCMQTSIDGLRIVAERTGKYVGQTSTLWCGGDGEWKDIWLGKNPPAAAKVGILRKDFKEPIFGIALFSEFFNSTNRILWEKMPTHMLSKCAESIALRKAFPMELSGVYSQEEFPPEPIREETLRKQETSSPNLSIDSTIAENQLPSQLREKGLTFLELAQNGEKYPFVWEGEKDGKKISIQCDGRSILDKWRATPAHPYCELAKKAIAFVLDKQTQK